MGPPPWYHRGCLNCGVGGTKPARVAPIGSNGEPKEAQMLQDAHSTVTVGAPLAWGTPCSGSLSLEGVLLSIRNNKAQVQEVPSGSGCAATVAGWEWFGARWDAHTSSTAFPAGSHTRTRF